MTNLDVAKKLVDRLASLGVQEVCLCTGARNAALVEAFSNGNLKIYNFFDERTAGFFALGRARQSQRPVVVCTTSGTAVAELLPATIEARYVGAPLVLLTADRPKRFRKTGAPQTIDQVSFLRSEVAEQYDIEHWPAEIQLKSYPVHVNICFEEPVLSAPFGASEEPVPVLNFSLCQKPLVIVGALQAEDRSGVLEWMERQSCYCILEAHSGLSGHAAIPPEKQLASQVVTAANFSRFFDGVIRIGGVPTARIWRDLDYELKQTPVISFSQEAWSGRGLGLESARPLRELKNWDPQFISIRAQELEALQQSFLLRIEKLEVKFPKSELALIRKLSEQVHQGCSVYIGNSLPIREWDSVARPRPDLQIYTQRGVNGIDGLISTFLGMLNTKSDNVLVVGDLSAFYDSNAFWLLRQIPPEASFKIVVMNNHGGRIFRKMFANPALQLEHPFGFESFAKLWQLPHYKVQTVDEWSQVWPDLPVRALIEVEPDLLDSDLAWKEIYG